MNKNVLVVSSSLRSHSNSERLADEFVRGVQESENYAEHISPVIKPFIFVKGCLTCQESQRCVIHDDADMIVQKMRTADVIVFATPIYYYEMSGQMKTLLDRANPLFFSQLLLPGYLFAGRCSGGRHTCYRWRYCWVTRLDLLLPKAHLAGTILGTESMQQGLLKVTRSTKSFMKWESDIIGAGRQYMAEASDTWGIFYQNLIDAGWIKEMVRQCVILAKGSRKSRSSLASLQTSLYSITGCTRKPKADRPPGLFNLSNEQEVNSIEIYQICLQYCL